MLGNLLLFEVCDVTVDSLSLLEFLFALDQEFNSVDDHLDELNLGEADAVSVADVEGSVV